jgi:hypothetical protein
MRNRERPRMAGPGAFVLFSRRLVMRPGVVARLGDPAATDSPAARAAVPWALGRFTAEFGMGSGVAAPRWPPGHRTGPLPWDAAAAGARPAAVEWLDPACRVCPCGARQARTSGHRLRGLALRAGSTALRPWNAAAPPAVACRASGLELSRAIRTARLRRSPGVHPRPIDVVVSHGPVGRPRLEAGFPLRCLQRLSVPRLATRRCGWRHNRCTRGASVPVLSYWGRALSGLLRPRQIGTELSHDVLNPAHVPL